MNKKRPVNEKPRCAECGKPIPPYRQHFCEKCYAKMLEEK